MQTENISINAEQHRIECKSHLLACWTGLDIDFLYWSMDEQGKSRHSLSHHTIKSIKTHSRKTQLSTKTSGNYSYAKLATNFTNVQEDWGRKVRSPGCPMHRPEMKTKNMQNKESSDHRSKKTGGKHMYEQWSSLFWGAKRMSNCENSRPDIEWTNLSYVENEEKLKYTEQKRRNAWLVIQC